MNRSQIKKQIEPSILKYARLTSGFTVEAVSKKTKIKTERIDQLESEGVELSIPQLEKLAKAYNRPLAFFLLKKIPKDVVLPNNFRIVYESEDSAFSPKLWLAIRRARYSQSIIEELRENKIQYAFKTVSKADDPDLIASDFRSLINVSLKTQNTWASPSAALKNWKVAIEKLNIFVLQQSLPSEDVSAFCLADKAPYIIVLNSSEHENRRIFSLFHEIGHILLHASGICTPDNLSKNSYEYIQLEKFCNQFAASFLVPIDDFIHDPQVNSLKNVQPKSWQDEDILKICSRFKVSKEVIYRRLLSIGFLNEADYKQKRNDVIEEYKKSAKLKKGKKIIVPEYRKVVSKNGYAFSAFILQNLQSNKITLSDAADFLNTNSRHIKKVESSFLKPQLSYD